ncbi:tetratricopeptide repeat protein [Orbaceae bacterium ac157xtp]
MKKLSYLLLPLSFLFLSGFTYDFPECDYDEDEYNLEECRRIAESGNPKAMVNLGHLYDYEIDDYGHTAEALYWYNKAAERGEDRAQFQLGHFYESGIGVAPSDAKALVWYLKAAEQNNTDAMYRIGQFYKNGWAVKKAAEWYKRAADLGDRYGQKAFDKLLDELAEE